MRFVTFQNRGAAEAGVIKGEQIIGLWTAGYTDLVSVITGGAEAIEKIQHWAAHPPLEERHPLSSTKLLAPIPRPPKIICVGLNYRDHAAESKMEIPSTPTIFSKYSNAVIGPGENIVLPKNSTKPDYEAEFAFVIGKGGRHIPPERWQDHVFGYTAFNDVSARDFQMATTQWMMGKTFDTFAPMGPWIVTADETADPHALDISLSIDGEVMQSSNTRNLIFRIPDLIAHLSSVFTLEPGDVISTGTPAGVGFAKKPPRWLKPGDNVVVTIQGIGELRNPVVAEAEDASAAQV
jgi:2-keto-4-pentenoate hydratase/2-oxohepta-3-ene-1,7-dioic acid hydratase in catechol pathway